MLPSCTSLHNSAFFKSSLQFSIFAASQILNLVNKTGPVTETANAECQLQKSCGTTCWIPLIYRYVCSPSMQTWNLTGLQPVGQNHDTPCMSVHTLPKLNNCRPALWHVVGPTQTLICKYILRTCLWSQTNRDSLSCGDKRVTLVTKCMMKIIRAFSVFLCACNSVQETERWLTMLRLMCVSRYVLGRILVSGYEWSQSACGPHAGQWFTRRATAPASVQPSCQAWQ